MLKNKCLSKLYHDQSLLHVFVKCDFNFIFFSSINFFNNIFRIIFTFYFLLQVVFVLVLAFFAISNAEGFNRHRFYDYENRYDVKFVFVKQLGLILKFFFLKPQRKPQFTKKLARNLVIKNTSAAL